MQLVAQTIVKQGEWDGAWDHCVLTYEERFLRRKVLKTAHDEEFLVDLEQVTSVDHRDAFKLADGRLIEVIAAEEDLLEVTGPHLLTLAWHIGNRHTPCQIDDNRLLIQRDHVLKDMLQRLGAEVREVSEPFVPVGGAYGHGRTHGHAHTDAQGHAVGHSHDHSHSHSHDHHHHSHD